jgi:hypothetical protein
MCSLGLGHSWLWCCPLHFVEVFSSRGLLCCSCVEGSGCGVLTVFVGVPMRTWSFLVHELFALYRFLLGFLLINWTLLFFLINRLRQSFRLYLKKLQCLAGAEER